MFFKFIANVFDENKEKYMCKIGVVMGDGFDDAVTKICNDYTYIEKLTIQEISDFNTFTCYECDETDFKGLDVYDNIDDIY